MVQRSHFVEIGRVVCINYGPNAGKICVIVDVLDSVKVLVDGPGCGVDRALMPLRHLSLTGIKCNIPRSPKSATLAKQMVKDDIAGQWAKTSWARKIAQAATRKNLSDFDRFKVMVLRKKRSSVVGKELAKLKKGKK